MREHPEALRILINNVSLQILVDPPRLVPIRVADLA